MKKEKKATSHRFSRISNPASKFFFYKRHGLVRYHLRGLHSRLLDIGSGFYRIRSDAIALDLKKEKRPEVAAVSYQLPFRSESLDGVTLLEVVEHLSEKGQRATFHEVRRILKPEGLFVISMPNLSKWWSVPYKIVWFFWERTVMREYIHEHIGMCSQSHFENLLKDDFTLLASQRTALLDRIFVCSPKKEVWTASSMVATHVRRQASGGDKSRTALHSVSSVQ